MVVYTSELTILTVNNFFKLVTQSFISRSKTRSKLKIDLNKLVLKADVYISYFEMHFLYNQSISEWK